MASSASSSQVIWIDGRLCSPLEPTLRADDHALVGDGAFEAIKVVDGQPFALTRHLTRLRRSLAPLDIDLDTDAARAATHALMSTPQANRSLSWLRITVTGGSAPMGTGSIGSRPTMIAALAPMTAWAGTTDVVIAPWVRNERGPTTGLKTISYADNVIAFRFARTRGADEAIFANSQGQLCEGSGSNVVIACEDGLVTPTLAAGCLPGITRELLLEWLPGCIEERDMPVAALAGADEAFLTSTSRSVHPIARVDDAPLASAPGPLTRHASAVWERCAAQDIDP